MTGNGIPGPALDYVLRVLHLRQISLADLRSRSRAQELVEARAAIVAVLRNRYGMEWADIAAFLHRSEHAVQKLYRRAGKL